MKKILLFVFLCSCFCFCALAQDKSTESGKGSGIGTGRGSGSGSELNSVPPKSTDSATVTPIKILSKTPANYTDAARLEGVEGVVRLRVTFLSTGEIGSVTPVSGLAYGLTEQAIAAARLIKFQPATRNGVPYSVVKTVEYNFYIVYRENDEELTANAKILEMPKPAYPQGDNFKNLSGKVKLTVTLGADGSVRVVSLDSDLPKEFQQKTVEAANLLKFEPAVHKNGKNVTQIKEIEYEFSPQNN